MVEGYITACEACGAFPGSAHGPGTPCPDCGADLIKLPAGEIEDHEPRP